MNQTPEQNSKKNITKGLLKAWLILLIPITLLVGAFHWYPKYSLRSHATKCTAYVSAKYPYNHQNIEYSYSVEGRQYKGITYDQRLRKPFKEVSIGDSLVIEYDATNPRVSSDTSAETDLAVATSESIGMSIVIPFALVLLWSQFLSQSQGLEKRINKLRQPKIK